MPEITIRVGGRPYLVACQSGEEKFLESAAELLDAEATALLRQIGKLPENRMLLMAGLMLADREGANSDQTEAQNAEFNALRGRISELEAALAEAESRPAEKVEVPVIPADLTDGLAEMTAQAESLAARLQDRLTPASDTADTDA